MARRSRRSSNAQAAGWPYLLVGLAFGLAVAAGVYFSDLRSGAMSAGEERAAVPRPRSGAPAAAEAPSGASAPSDAGREATGAAQTRASAAAATAGADAPPRFEFYEILPEYEVVVPEVERVARLAGSARTGPAPPAVETPGSYVVQAGSFRSHADADRRQASLALLGIESRIQRVTIDDDEFHRVRVGPISDLGELNRIRSELERAGVDTLTMKVNE